MERTQRFRARVAASVLACMVIAMLALFTTAAFAQQEPYSGEEPKVLPTRIKSAPRDSVKGRRYVLPNARSVGDVQAQINDGGGDVLPFTGADVTVYAVGGILIVGAGALIVRRTRTQ